MVTWLVPCSKLQAVETSLRYLRLHVVEHKSEINM
jgi:hypothetical protein